MAGLTRGTRDSGLSVHAKVHYCHHQHKKPVCARPSACSCLVWLAASPNSLVHACVTLGTSNGQPGNVKHKSTNSGVRCRSAGCSVCARACLI